MTIDLHNFFKYYKSDNSQHVSAIQWLEDNLPEEFLKDDSEWVEIFRSKNKGKFSNPLPVPYFPQTDNYRDADRTCNSSSCAMCLEYFKRGTLKGDKGDDSYVRKVFSIGDTTNHSVQTKVLESYGIKSSFFYNLTFADLDRELLAGRPVVIGILHRGPLSAPRGGHMCVVIGKRGEDYIVNDPYGNLNDGYSSSVYNGKEAIYKRHELKIRWCPNGNDGWGRIFDSSLPLLEQNKSSGSTDELPKEGLELIKEFEGCILKAYPDPLSGGLPITIGWGSTKDKNGNPFKLGDVITKEQAEELLVDECKKHIWPIIEKIPYFNEMTNGQKGALLSFAYNLGPNFYGASDFSTITKRLKNKEWDLVPDALFLYRNPGTPVEAGLACRRRAEGDLWRS